MANVEKLETNKVKLTFDISKEKLSEGVDFAYKKNRNQFNIPGFRKGKVPKAIIINNYGEGVFYEDAVNHVLPEIYEAIIKEENLQTVSKPDIDILSISLKDGAEVTALVYLKPEVTVNEYKGIKYIKEAEEVTDEDINKVLHEEQVKNSRTITVEDRPVAGGDIVNIDFEGFMDGVPFEGGKGTDYDLEIGSKTFIDTFEDQLIGHNLNEEVEVNVSFPEDYGKEDLQNKPALFKVKINEIKYNELPELDDDFAQDVSEFDTLDEYKKSISEKLAEDKKKSARHSMENQVMEEIVKRTEVDLPEVMVENKIDEFVNDSARRLSSSGISLEDFLNYQGQTMEDFRDSFKEIARKQVVNRLALEYIAKSENLEATEEELNEELKKIADSYNIPFDKLKELSLQGEEENIKLDIVVKKAADLVFDSSLAVEN